MRISSHGMHRDHGPKTLAKSAPAWIQWDEETNRLEVTVPGVEGKTTLKYVLELKASEVAKLVKTAVDGACSDPATKAFGAAMAAFLTSVLPEPERATNRK